MFTGIIRHTGRFKGYRRAKQEILVEAAGLAPDIETGQSLSVNGVCLSLVGKERSALAFDLSRETLVRTTLGTLRPGEKINLEMPLTPSSFIGGHLVSGHVDFKARTLKVRDRKPGKRLAFFLPQDHAPFFIPKGSVAVNGVSLTVAAVGPGDFEVEIIPITLRETNLGELRPGLEANVECDMIGKYMYNWWRRGNR